MSADSALNVMNSEELNRRARKRARSFKHARILFNNTSVYDAVLKNVSAYGATLSVTRTDILPDNFKLHIVHDDVTVPCRVKWRRFDSMGVTF